MSTKKQTKELILHQLNNQLDQKIKLIKKEIEAAKESRDNETKSSVGDKYETGRAMMQMELEKNQFQLSNTQNLKTELSKIDLKKEYRLVKFGSCIVTNRGNYFISVGFGKIEIEDNPWYCISISSPIGNQLLEKKVGDYIQFQGNKFIVKEIF